MADVGEGGGFFGGVGQLERFDEFGVVEFHFVDCRCDGIKLGSGNVQRGICELHVGGWVVMFWACRNLRRIC